MSGLFGGGKQPTVTPAPSPPTRTDAETADLAAVQRERVRRAFSARGARGSLGSPTGGSAAVRLLGGTA